MLLIPRVATGKRVVIYLHDAHSCTVARGTSYAEETNRSIIDHGRHRPVPSFQIVNKNKTSYEIDIFIRLAVTSSLHSKGSGIKLSHR